jgi:hypothetical protein
MGANQRFTRFADQRLVEALDVLSIALVLRLHLILVVQFGRLHLVGRAQYQVDHHGLPHIGYPLR